MIEPCGRVNNTRPWLCRQPRRRNSNGPGRSHRLGVRAPVTLALLACAAWSGELRFAREDIRVDVVSTDTILVRGLYVFRSATGTSITEKVFYPFPVDSTSAPPCSVAVFGGGSDITCTPARNGVIFDVAVPDAGICSVTVVYKQQVHGNTGRYILTTTAAWNAPLGPSTYTATVPDSIPLMYLSYESDTVYSSGGRLVYRFARDRFMPDKDMILRWGIPSGDSDSADRQP